MPINELLWSCNVVRLTKLDNAFVGKVPDNELLAIDKLCNRDNALSSEGSELVSEFEDRSNRVNACREPNTIGIFFAKLLPLRIRLPRFFKLDISGSAPLPNPPVATSDRPERSMVVTVFPTHVTPVHEHHTTADASLALLGQLLPELDHGLVTLNRNARILKAIEHKAVTSVRFQL